MEPKNNVIVLRDVRKRRKIQKLKYWFMKPTIVASILMLTIYGILIGNYFMEKDRHPLIYNHVESENLTPYELNK